MRILLEINRIFMSYPCHFHRIVTWIFFDKKLQKINIQQGFEPLTFVVLADPLHPFAIQALLRQGELILIFILQFFQGPIQRALLYYKNNFAQGLPSISLTLNLFSCILFFYKLRIFSKNTVMDKKDGQDNKDDNKILFRL